MRFVAMLYKQINRLKILFSNDTIYRSFHFSKIVKLNIAGYNLNLIKSQWAISGHILDFPIRPNWAYS